MISFPIIDSILNGELRPCLIDSVISEKEMTECLRTLRKVDTDRRYSIEIGLADALVGLIPLDSVYEKFKDYIRSANDARTLFVEDEGYIPIGQGCLLEGVFKSEMHSTPKMRLYAMLISLECQRTIMALYELHITLRSNMYTRCELMRVFDKIMHLCKQAKRDLTQHPLVKEMVLQELAGLYFSLMLNYKYVLEEEARCTSDDFSDLYYELWGCYPEKDVVSRYESYWDRPSVSPADSQTTNDTELATKEKNKNLSKEEQFLEKVEPFSFLSCPMVADLGSRAKVIALLKIALENPGHAAAMFEYLGFFEHIKKNKLGKYPKTKYDEDMSNALGLMGSAFANYRKSNPNVPEPASKYKSQCSKEYNNIRRSRKIE